LIVLGRKAPKRLNLTKADRLLFAWLYRIQPEIISSIQIVKPETVIRWHRQGFRLFWRWKSRGQRVGRPKIDKELRELIRRMSRENLLWGAPRIHGELLMLGFDVAQSTAAKYMIKLRKPPSQTWKTFLHNHADAITAADFFVVPTISFQLLFVFVVIGHVRRRLIHFAVTANPTSEWTARQIIEAFPWDTAPK
jgi:putative transposase